jgi:hypothetical protein
MQDHRCRNQPRRPGRPSPTGKLTLGPLPVALGQPGLIPAGITDRLPLVGPAALRGSGPGRGSCITQRDKTAVSQPLNPVAIGQVAGTCTN